MYDSDAVDAVRRMPIDALEKGFGGPLHDEPVSALDLAARRPGLGDGWLGGPVSVLSQPALDNNVQVMAAYCERHGARLYPHGKTTMAPQLLARQLDSGAGGVTVATPGQARLFARFGVRTILIANEVTDSSGVAWLAEHAASDGRSTVVCYVDSLEGVSLLERELGRRSATMGVLLEVGHEHGRTGARTRRDAHAVADAVAASPHLSLVGVAGYEGSISRPTAEATVGAAREYCRGLGEITNELSDRGRFATRPLVTAGGSAYFDAVVDALSAHDEWDLVLRSGCYLTHDDGLYRSISAFERHQEGPGLRSALHVWAPVLSRPERGLVVLGVGRRDVSTDSGLPVLLGARRGDDVVEVGDAVADRIYDQHLVVNVSADSALTVGDQVRLGVSHPCTTFDKWRWIPVVDAEERVVDVVRTFF